MKTHRERAESVANVLLLRADLYQHAETGDEKTAAELIAQETYPAELVESAEEVLDLAVCEDGYGRIGAPRRDCECPACQPARRLQEALAAYDHRHDSCTNSGHGG